MTEVDLGVPGYSYRTFPRSRKSRDPGDDRNANIVPETNRSYKEGMLDARSKLHKLVVESEPVRASIVNACKSQGIPSDRFVSVLLSVIDHFNVAQAPTPSTDLPRAAPEFYQDRPVLLGEGRREDVVEFLRRVWKPWIENGLLTRVELRKLDLKADKAIDNWIQKHDQLPEDVRLLTKKEVIDNQIAADPKGAISDPRLARAIVSRMQRGQRIPGIEY